MSYPSTSELNDLLEAQVTHSKRLTLIIDRWARFELEIQQIMRKTIWAISWLKESTRLMLMEEITEMIEKHDATLEEYKESVTDFHNDFIRLTYLLTRINDETEKR